MENLNPFAELDIAETIIEHLNRQSGDMAELIALLQTKVRARDLIIGRLSRKIAQLENELGMDELPPIGLRDAFAGLN
jgi:hypothetical protein